MPCLLFLLCGVLLLHVAPERVHVDGAVAPGPAIPLLLLGHVVHVVGICGVINLM